VIDGNSYGNYNNTLNGTSFDFDTFEVVTDVASTSYEVYIDDVELFSKDQYDDLPS
jgi:hypothetical protein